MLFLPLEVFQSKQWQQKKKFDDREKKCRTMGFVYFTVKQYQTDTNIQDKEYIYIGLSVCLSSEDGHTNYIVLCSVQHLCIPVNIRITAQSNQHLLTQFSNWFPVTKNEGPLFMARLLYWITLYITLYYSSTGVWDVIQDVICYRQELINDKV